MYERSDSDGGSEMRRIVTKSIDSMFRITYHYVIVPSLFLSFSLEIVFKQGLFKHYHHFVHYLN